MSVCQSLVNSLQDNLLYWDCSYDNENEKYVISSREINTVLNNEHIEFIKKSNLEIFSIHRTYSGVVIYLVSTGGSLY